MRRHSIAARRTPASRHFILVCTVAVALSALLKLPALLSPPAEADEQIYWQLAERLSATGEYSLRGSPLLASLSPHVYDRPLFHHPPLFAAALVPFVWTASPGAAVLVSWTGHALAILAAAMIGRTLLQRRGREDEILTPAFSLPILGVAADPLLAFVSKRLWIDGLLAGLVAVSIAVAIAGMGTKRRFLLVLAGFLLGLAGLAKLTGLLVLPLLLVMALRGEQDWNGRARAAAALVLPVALLVVPWLAAFYYNTGVVLPSWVKPDEQLMSLYPFLRTAVERPWHYYLTTLIAISPAVMLLAWTAVAHRMIWRDPVFQLAAGWLLLIVLAQTLLALDGYGFQMRHIAPAVTALWVCLLCLLLERPRPVLQFLIGAAILLGTATASMHLLVPELDEMLTLGTVGRLIF